MAQERAGDEIRRGGRNDDLHDGGQREYDAVEGGAGIQSPTDAALNTDYCMYAKPGEQVVREAYRAALATAPRL